MRFRETWKWLAIPDMHFFALFLRSFIFCCVVSSSSNLYTVGFQGSGIREHHFLLSNCWMRLLLNYTDILGNKDNLEITVFTGKPMATKPIIRLLTGHLLTDLSQHFCFATFCCGANHLVLDSFLFSYLCTWAHIIL